MKHYFITVRCHIPKNKAHEALQNFAKKYDSLVMDEANLARVIEKLKEKTMIVNRTFTRCQDIDIREHRYARFDEVAVYVDSNFNMNANLVKGFMINEPIQVV